MVYLIYLIYLRFDILVMKYPGLEVQQCSVQQDHIVYVDYIMSNVNSVNSVNSVMSLSCVVHCGMYNVFTR